MKTRTKAVIATVSILIFNGGLSNAQNIGINTDGTTAETGVMLDVKAPATNAKATTAAAQTFFQLKSFDADASALKLRLGFKTDATQANRYGFMEFLEAGTPTYLNLALQPAGGNVGIGTTAPDELFHVSSTTAGAGAHIGNVYTGNWDGSNGFAVFTNNTVKGTSSSYALLQQSTGATYLNAAAGTNMYFRINNADKMFLSSTGNFGIGNTTAAEKLEVTGNIRTSSLAGTGTVVVAADPNGTLQRTTISSSSAGSCCSGWSLSGVITQPKATNSGTSTNTALAGKEYLLVVVSSAAEFTVATTDNVFLIQGTRLWPSKGYNGDGVNSTVNYDFGFNTSAAVGLTVEEPKVYFCIPFLNGSATDVLQFSINSTIGLFVGIKGNGTFYMSKTSAGTDVGVYIFEK